MSSRLFVFYFVLFKFHAEALPRPGHQLIAVVTFLTRSIVSGEMLEPDHHWVFGFFFVVGFAGFIAQPLFEWLGLQVAHFIGIDLNAKFILGPAAGGAHAVIDIQEARACRQIDLLDCLSRMLQHQFDHAVAARLFQIAIAKIRFPSRGGKFCQRLPVPISFFTFGQVFLDRLEHLGFGLPLGLVFRLPLGILEIEAPKIAGVEFDRKQAAGPFGEGFGAVIVIEKHIQTLIDLRCRSCRGSSRGSCRLRECPGGTSRRASAARP